MEILDDLRKLFARRRKGAVVDVDAPRAEYGTDQVGDGGREAGAATGSGKGDSRPWRLRPVDDRSPQLEQLITMQKELRERVDGLFERVGGLRSQDSDSPEPLQGLMDTVRQNAQMLHSIQERMGRDDDHADATEAALDKLWETVRQQADVLGLLQQQLDSNSRSASQLVDALDSLRPSLAEAATDGKQINKLLTELSAATTRHDEEVHEAMARTQRLMMIAVIVAGVAAAAAIAAVILVIV